MEGAQLGDHLRVRPAPVATIVLGGAPHVGEEALHRRLVREQLAVQVARVPVDEDAAEVVDDGIDRHWGDHTGRALRSPTMSAIVMNGDVVADEVKSDLRVRVADLAERGVTPGLGTILVGDDEPSAKYVSMKHRDAADLGLHTRELHLPSHASQDDVGVAIEVMNNDPKVDAFIVQYPFPAGLDYERAILEMDPEKDADGLHPVNLGWLVMGREAPLACTPAGILRLLEHYEVPVAGQHVVVVGRGLTIGRPLANLLSLKR